jgi:hypothetical protein
MKRAVLLLPALLLAACSPPRPTPAEYLAVVPQIVRFMETDARQNAPGQPAQGPLMIDVRSFTANGARMVGSPVDSTRFRQAVGRPFEPVAAEDSVLLLEETGTAAGKWVKRYGVYLHLNQVRAAGDEMTAVVRSTTTDRRGFPTELCDRVWRLNFHRGANGAWALHEKNLRFSCLEPNKR